MVSVNILGTPYPVVRSTEVPFSGLLEPYGRADLNGRKRLPAGFAATDTAPSPAPGPSQCGGTPRNTRRSARARPRTPLPWKPRAKVASAAVICCDGATAAAAAGVRP